MPWISCEKCSESVFVKGKSSICWSCENRLANDPNAFVQTKKLSRTELVDQAIKEAKVLDGFGKFMQFLGYICIGVFALVCVIALFNSQWVLSLACLILIVFTFILYNVFGSVCRAISLYIQIKVK